LTVSAVVAFSGRGWILKLTFSFPAIAKPFLLFQSIRKSAFISSAMKGNHLKSGQHPSGQIPG
jgi:hypothetical protein